jgi:hypothetical protein
MLFGTGGGHDPGLLHWIDEVDAFAALAVVTASGGLSRDPGPGRRAEALARQLQTVHVNRLFRRNGR